MKLIYSVTFMTSCKWWFANCSNLLIKHKHRGQEQGPSVLSIWSYLPSPQEYTSILFSLNQTRGLSALNSLKPTWKQKRIQELRWEWGETYLKKILGDPRFPSLQGKGCHVLHLHWRIPAAAVRTVAILLESQRVSKPSWQLPPVAQLCNDWASCSFYRLVLS